MPSTRRQFLTASAAAAAASCAAPEPAAKAPNLVLVFPDQMRGSAMGFLGEEPVQTPRLDAFAKQSLALTQAASIYPVCSPYRAMLMSGLFPRQSKVVSNCTNHSYAYGVELQQADRCWSDVLADAGYSLGYIGKWHLEGPKEPYVESYNNRADIAWNEWTPPERRHGFGFWHAYNTYDRHMAPWYWTTEMGRDDRLKIEQWGPEHEVDVAIEFLENAGGKRRDPAKPFALVVSMNPPHTPYTQYPEDYRGAYSEVSDETLFSRPNIPAAGTSNGDYYRKNIRDYFSMTTGVDHQFGRLLDALDRLDLAEDTLVVFTSDHGDCIGIHEEQHKNNHFEESMRVPFLARFPGRIAPRRDSLLFSNIDIYPTVLDLLGLGDKIPAAVGGASHAAAFRGEKAGAPESQVYLKMPFENPERGRRGLRTERYTVMLDSDTGQTELYDRQKDPYQLENLASEKAGLVAELLEDGIQPWLDKGDDPWTAPKA
ncbi:MAG: sulfatase-like hydrolase/transferase [Acidobacteria bacterium]|nr:sulfatase-like hydrolase/transferase [Acidobacteriota bacterium]